MVLGGCLALAKWHFFKEAQYLVKYTNTFATPDRSKLNLSTGHHDVLLELVQVNDSQPPYMQTLDHQPAPVQPYHILPATAQVSHDTSLPSPVSSYPAFPSPTQWSPAPVQPQVVQPVPDQLADADVVDQEPSDLHDGELRRSRRVCKRRYDNLNMDSLWLVFR